MLVLAQHLALVGCVLAYSYSADTPHHTHSAARQTRYMGTVPLATVAQSDWCFLKTLGSLHTYTVQLRLQIRCWTPLEFWIFGNLVSYFPWTNMGESQILLTIYENKRTKWQKTNKKPPKQQTGTFPEETERNLPHKQSLGWSQTGSNSPGSTINLFCSLCNFYNKCIRNFTACFNHAALIQFHSLRWMKELLLGKIVAWWVIKDDIITHTRGMRSKRRFLRQPLFCNFLTLEHLILIVFKTRK